MKIWSIEENTAAVEIAAVLNEYGDALVQQTDQKLGYFVDIYLDKNLLVFVFNLKYKPRIFTNNIFDLSSFNEEIIKICKIYYDKNSNGISLGWKTGEPYEGKKTIINIMEDVISMKKTNNIISNIMYLSNERGYKPIEKT